MNSVKMKVQIRGLATLSVVYAISLICKHIKLRTRAVAHIFSIL